MNKFFFSNFIMILILVISFCSLGGCTSTGRVSCINPQKFSSDAGYLNVPRLGLGKVELVDTIKKILTPVQVCKTDSTDIFQTAKIDTFSILISTGFSIQLSGQITKANQSIKAGASTSISNNTVAFMKNSFSKEISSPTDIANKTSCLSQIQKALKSNLGCIALLVYKVIYSDQFKFETKKAITGEADANILQYGDYSIKIQYDCDGSAYISGIEAPTFYKVMYLKLDSNNQLVPTSQNIDLTQYRIIDALE